MALGMRAVFAVWKGGEHLRRRGAMLDLKAFDVSKGKKCPELCVGGPKALEDQSKDRFFRT